MAANLFEGHLQIIKANKQIILLLHTMGAFLDMLPPPPGTPIGDVSVEDTGE